MQPEAHSPYRFRIAERLLYTGFVWKGGSPPPAAPADTAVVPALLPPVAAAPPLAATFTASCTRASCSLDASASAGGVAPYTGSAWSFGDGSASAASSSSTVTYRYAAKGSYSVTLTVIDASGQRATTSQTVIIRRL
jgi:PKD repeat protein